jgi:hypothetical protein
MNANTGTVLIRISAELISTGGRNTKYLKENVTGDKPGVSYKIMCVNDSCPHRNHKITDSHKLSAVSFERIDTENLFLQAGY